MCILCVWKRSAFRPWLAMVTLISTRATSFAPLVRCPVMWQICGPSTAKHPTNAIALFSFSLICNFWHMKMSFNFRNCYANAPRLNAGLRGYQKFSQYSPIEKENVEEKICIFGRETLILRHITKLSSETRSHQRNNKNNNQRNRDWFNSIWIVKWHIDPF